MKIKNIAILNLGVGNSKSVYNALYTLGYESKIIDNGSQLTDFTHAIVPGVGAFDKAITSMRQNRFFDELLEFHATGKPILGICVGMQVLFTSSDEGSMGGLNLIPGNLTRILPSEYMNVPNTGWNNIEVTKMNKLIDLNLKPRMYHNHSYALQEPARPEVIAVTESQPNIVVGVESDLVFGVQFHPEKSHKPGIDLLKKFCEV